MFKSKLALCGGKPIRKKPFPPHNTIIDDAEAKEIMEVLKSGNLSGFSAVSGERFFGGPKVRKLESDFCRYFKCKYAVSFNSGTSALHGAIAAIGTGPGDEVITSAYTMSASASCILMQNAIPVFADINPDTFTIEPKSVRERITKRTKAILAVNLFGHPAELDELKRIAKENNLVLIEDDAQSPGAFYKNRLAGTIGEIGIFSLNYHKTIQTGEGGIAVTNNQLFADRLKLVRNHGEAIAFHKARKDSINILGWNYRMTELQAAVGIPQLKKLKFFNEIRQELAGVLTNKLKPFDFLTLPVVRDYCTHVYYLYTMKYKKEKIGIDRKTFVMALRSEGFPVEEGYIRPLYLQPIYQHRVAYGHKGCPFLCSLYKGKICYRKGLCPVTERMYEKEVITTRICRYPNKNKDILDFARAVEKIFDNIGELKSFSKRNKRNG